jgi:hypothetical protein
VQLHNVLVIVFRDRLERSELAQQLLVRSVARYHFLQRDVGSLPSAFEHRPLEKVGKTNQTNVCQQPCQEKRLCLHNTNEPELAMGKLRVNCDSLEPQRFVNGNLIGICSAPRRCRILRKPLVEHTEVRRILLSIRDDSSSFSRVFARTARISVEFSRLHLFHLRIVGNDAELFSPGSQSQEATPKR